MMIVKVVRVNQVNLREQKKELTRTAILQTAKRLFADKGYQRTTTAEIARLIGIAEGTLFNYFHTKADLFMAAMMPALDDLKIDGRDGAEYPHNMPGLQAEEWSRCIIAMIDRSLSGLTTIDKSVLREYFAIVFGHSHKDRADAKQVLFRADEQVIQEVGEFFRAQKAAHSSLDHFDIELAARSILGCIVYHLSEYVLVESISYAAMLARMEEQITFALTGHLS